MIPSIDLFTFSLYFLKKVMILQCATIQVIKIVKNGQSSFIFVNQETKFIIHLFLNGYLNFVIVNQDKFNFTKMYFLYKYI